MNKEILRIALPSIVTNITIPLLGLVDVAIVGHMTDVGDAAPYIGAIAVGGLIFNMVYWLFGFLRMGTSGLTAQAYGAQHAAGQMQVLVQAVTVSLVCSISIFLLQWPIENLSHWLIAPSPDVWQLALTYFRIRIWAAPAVLLLFSVNGWFVGMQNSRYPMYIAVGRNIVNIVASLYFVFVLDWGVAGVAWGTVISQYAGLLAAAILWWHRYGHTMRHATPSLRSCLHTSAMGRFFTVNRDIFLRLLFIIAVTCAFTALGARQGDRLLAVNTLLIQLYTFFSYFVDGFALTGEALVGKYVGAHDHKKLMQCVRYLFCWCSGVAILFTFTYVLFGHNILTLLTDDASVIAACTPYFGWTLIVPVVSFAAFLWDGVFIGATATRQMLYTLIAGSVLFFAIYYLLPHFINILPLPIDFSLSTNHRLWLAFIGYLAMRSIYQSKLAVGVLAGCKEKKQTTSD